MAKDKNNITDLIEEILIKYEIGFIRKVGKKYSMLLWQKSELCKNNEYDEIKVSEYSLLDCFIKAKQYL